jgi:hypothetical protein
LTALVALVALTALSACGTYGSTPSAAQTPTPRPLVYPMTMTGPLRSVTIDQFGLTLLVPSDWKAPVALDDHRFVLSPDGSADTSANAGPFLLLIVGSGQYFHSRLSFRQGLTDPVDQLSAIISALNLNEPEVGEVAAYNGAKYPAATVEIFSRGNEQTIVLMNAGNDRWIYIGAQSKEIYFRYYETAVFRPATDSIVLSS